MNPNFRLITEIRQGNFQNGRICSLSIFIYFCGPAIEIERDFPVT